MEIRCQKPTQKLAVENWPPLEGGTWKVRYDDSLRTPSERRLVFAHTPLCILHRAGVEVQEKLADPEPSVRQGRHRERRALRARERLLREEGSRPQEV